MSDVEPKRICIQFGKVRGQDEFDIDVDHSDGNGTATGVCRLPCSFDGIEFPEPNSHAAEAMRGVIFRRANDSSDSDGIDSGAGVVTPAQPAGRFVFQDEKLKEVGERLYKEILPSEAQVWLKDAMSDQRPVELQIDLTKAPKLANEPFEALYMADNDSPFFLSTNVQTRISRYIKPKGAGKKRKPIKSPVKALFIAASPHDQLDVEDEINKIKSVLENDDGKQTNTHIDWTFRSGTTQPLLEDWLEEEEWDIIHFVGHGGYDSETETHFLLLHDDENPKASNKIPADEFWELLQNDTVSLIVLNACGSGQTSSAGAYADVARGLVNNHVPFVVAMRDRISDEAAKVFAAAFYRRLAKRNAVTGDFPSVSEAVTIGRHAVRKRFSKQEWRRVEFTIPVLYTSDQTKAVKPFIGGGDPFLKRVWKFLGVSSAEIGSVGVIVGIVGTLLVAVGIVWAFYDPADDESVLVDPAATEAVDELVDSTTELPIEDTDGTGGGDGSNPAGAIDTAIDVDGTGTGGGRPSVGSETIPDVVVVDPPNDCRGYTRNLLVKEWSDAGLAQYVREVSARVEGCSVTKVSIYYSGKPSVALSDIHGMVEWLFEESGVVGPIVSVDPRRKPQHSSQIANGKIDSPDRKEESYYMVVGLKPSPPDPEAGTVRAK